MIKPIFFIVPLLIVINACSAKDEEYAISYLSGTWESPPSIPILINDDSKAAQNIAANSTIIGGTFNLARTDIAIMSVKSDTTGMIIYRDKGIASDITSTPILTITSTGTPVTVVNNMILFNDIAKNSKQFNVVDYKVYITTQTILNRISSEKWTAIKFPDFTTDDIVRQYIAESSVHSGRPPQDYIQEQTVFIRQNGNNLQKTNPVGTDFSSVISATFFDTYTTWIPE